MSAQIGAPQAESSPLSIVSPQRLMQLSSRLRDVENTAGTGELHQLVRFNLLNFGSEPTTVCAIGLTSASRETLRCEIVPAVLVREGARYPFMLEIRTGLGSQTVDIEVERGPDERVWVSVASLPSWRE
jgi:hypothetical protein